MKIAAYERAKHVAGRTAGGAALGAALGAGGAALAGKDWKDGAKAGAAVGGALGMARGAHNVRRYTHIGKGVSAEKGEAHGSNSESFKRGKAKSDQMSHDRYEQANNDISQRRKLPAEARDAFAEHAHDLQNRQKAKDKRELEYLRRRGKGQSLLHSAIMAGHDPFGREL